MHRPLFVMNALTPVGTGRGTAAVCTGRGTRMHRCLFARGGGGARGEGAIKALIPICPDACLIGGVACRARTNLNLHGGSCARTDTRLHFGGGEPRTPHRRRSHSPRSPRAGAGSGGGGGGAGRSHPLAPLFGCGRGAHLHVAGAPLSRGRARGGGSGPAKGGGGAGAALPVRERRWAGRGARRSLPALSRCPARLLSVSNKMAAAAAAVLPRTAAAAAAEVASESAARRSSGGPAQQH